MLKSKPLSLAVGTFLLLVIAGWAYSADRSEYYEDKALPWLVDALWELSSWRADDLRPLLAEEAKAIISNEQLATVVEQYKGLGRFQSLGETRFNRLAAVASLFSSKTHVGYTAHAEFDNGAALVVVTLLDNGDGEFSIFNINLRKAN